jgi:hypothetical protein
VCDIVANAREASEGRPLSVSPLDRFLFIVSRGNTKLASELKQHFSGSATVQVAVDRRFGERRQQIADVTAERRRADRRTRPHIDKEVRLTSFAIVTLPEPETQRLPLIL